MIRLRFILFIYSVACLWMRDVYDFNVWATSPYLSACYAPTCNTHRYNFSDLSAALASLSLPLSMHVQMLAHNSTLNSTTI